MRQANALVEAAGGTGRSYVRLKIALELARDDAPADGARRAAQIEAEALQREQLMLATHALLLRIELLGRCGEEAAAASEAQRLVAGCLQGGTSPGLYAPEVWWAAHLALKQSDADAARRCLLQAWSWIERAASQHVPEVFLDSFLNRNPVNAAVREAVRAHGITPQ